MAKHKRYIVVRPEDHDGWLEERKNHIGASDAAKVFGLNKYESVYQFWRIKLGIDPPPSENWAMRAGHVWEQYISNEFERVMAYKVIKASEGDWIAVDRKYPFLGVSPDRTFWYGEKKNDEGKALLECKSSRMPYKPEDLTDPSTCISWWIQVQLQLYVTGMKHAYLGFVNRDNGDQWFEHIDYDEEFCEKTLVPTLAKFWHDCVEPARDYLDKNGITPETIEYVHQYAPYADPSATDTILRHPQQTEGKSIKLDFEGLSEYIQRRSAIAELEAENKEFTDMCKVKMQDAESILDADGKVVATWKANKNGVRMFKVVAK